jgi:hypothetical protein
VYEIAVLKEYAELNDLTGIITVATGITAKAADLSLTDSVNIGIALCCLQEFCDFKRFWH